MNLEMTDVIVYSWKQRNVPVHCDHFHIAGKWIRFVNFDHYFNVAKVIHKSLDILKYKEKMAKQGETRERIGAATHTSQQ